MENAGVWWRTVVIGGEWWLWEEEQGGLMKKRGVWWRMRVKDGVMGGRWEKRGEGAGEVRVG